MFDIGWVEMMVVIVVMIVVIGPKDLPAVLHTMGQWIARVRAMAREFQSGIEDLADQAGLEDVRKEIDTIRDFSIKEEIEKTIDPKGELRQGIEADTPAMVTDQAAEKKKDEDGKKGEGDEEDEAAAPRAGGAPEGEDVLSEESAADEGAAPRREHPAGNKS